MVVTASQALVANWLLARLDDFSMNFPTVDVRLDVADRVIDLAQGEADIGIRCGLGAWKGVKSTFLMSEEIIAVCHNRLLEVDREVTAGWIVEQTLTARRIRAATFRHGRNGWRDPAQTGFR